MSETANGTGTIDRNLNVFLHERSNGRKFHRASIGDVDPYHCFADYLNCIKTIGSSKRAIGTEQLAAHRRLDKVYHARTKTAMAESTGGVTGGYLVPDELSYEFMEDVAEEAIIRPRATIIPMHTATLRVSFLDLITLQSAATSPFWGGLKWIPTQEAVLRTETEPGWRQLTLRAYDVGGYVLESNPLLQDGGMPLDARLRQTFTKAMAWYEDYLFLVGTGVGQPRGVLNSGASVAEGRSSSGHFTVTDIGKMSKDVIPGHWRNAIWTTHPLLWPEFMILGTNLWQINQPFPDNPQAPDYVLNGRAGYVTEKVPALGTKGDVMFFRADLYVIGDRGEIEIAFSDQEPTAWTKNQSVWRVIERVDGNFPWDSTIRLADGTTVVGPAAVLV